MKRIVCVIMAVVMMALWNTAVTAESRAAATDNMVLTEAPASTVPDRVMSGEQVTVSLTPAESMLKPGDEFTVELNISENHYITNCQIEFLFDPMIFELVEINPDNPDLKYVKSVNQKMLRSAFWVFRMSTPGRARFVASTMSSKGATDGGVLFPLTFRVLEGWYGRAAIEVNVTEMGSVNTSYGENYNTNIVVENAFVDVLEADFCRGDVNRDGVVDIADATMVFRAANGRVVLNHVQYRRAEVTGDGIADIADAVRMFRFANGRITQL